jgi:hypothetical protein
MTHLSRNATVPVHDPPVHFRNVIIPIYYWDIGIGIRTHLTITGRQSSTRKFLETTDRFGSRVLQPDPNRFANGCGFNIVGSDRVRAQHCRAGSGEVFISKYIGFLSGSIILLLVSFLSFGNKWKLSSLRENI